MVWNKRSKAQEDETDLVVFVKQVQEKQVMDKNERESSETIPIQDESEDEGYRSWSFVGSKSEVRTCSAGRIKAACSPF